MRNVTLNDLTLNDLTLNELVRLIFTGDRDEEVSCSYGLMLMKSHAHMVWIGIGAAITILNSFSAMYWFAFFILLIYGSCHMEARVRVRAEALI